MPSAALLSVVGQLCIAAVTGEAASVVCKTDLDCSLNGLCQSDGTCACDKPWGGPRCGVLQYKPLQSVLAKNMYPHNDTDAPKSGPCVTPTHVCDALNTWNGPIAGPIDGKYHMFNPLYRKGSLLTTEAMMYGTADNIEGPYTWTAWPNMGSNPAFATFTETDEVNGQTETVTKYSLWVGGQVYVASNISGPYNKTGPTNGGNPAPVFHNNTWYATSQQTSSVQTIKTIGDDWEKYATISARIDKGTQEDPFMWIDNRNNWHIINHAYDVRDIGSCNNSTLSAHVFSPNGIDWHVLEPNVEPYSHTVHYEDGTTHSYNTLERPNCHFNEQGVMTHINLAADLVSQDAGCADYQSCPAKVGGQCACTNCKYADHAGTIIIALDV